MVVGTRGKIGLLAFLIVDSLLIWTVNTSRTVPGTTAALMTQDRQLITLVLIGGAVIAILAAILFKSKPVPARFR